MIEIDILKELHGSDGVMDLHVNVTIDEGDFIALSGASGSGKTTLLRILAGLQSAQGTIAVSGEKWLTPSHSLAPQKRGIGFVFQDYALFDNMSVMQHLLYVNRDIKLAEHLLNITGLEALKDRVPQTLSGGQKQRVALCRAVMNRPKLLLLDEPLSALDGAMRERLQNEILTLHKEFGITTIMVSHDPSEMYHLAHRVIVLDQGKVINDGSAKEVLLKTEGSQKFSFEGRLLEIVKVDVVYIAIVSIGQQLVEVVISSMEAKRHRVGDTVTLSTKAFTPTLS
jgi:molybdate transport system ATP-binding protein